MGLTALLLGTVGVSLAVPGAGMQASVNGASDQQPTTPTTAPSATQTPATDEIIVTAQRRNERLQSVPLSVTVQTGRDLERQNIRSLEDLSNRTPDFRVARSTLADQLHIRGTGSGFNTGFEQSVATFVDGVYRSRSRSSRIALFDIDRVEVLKGPQTTFFGANAIAGALNIVTRKPGRVLEGNASALYSPSDGEYNAEAGISAPVSDTLSIRVAGRWSGMNGYVHNDRYDNDGPHLNDKQARASALWSPSDRVSVNLRFDIARLRDTGTFEGELYQCPPATGVPLGQCARNLSLGGPVDNALNYHSQTSAPGTLDLNFEEAEALSRVDLGGVSLISTTAYSHQRADATYEVAPYAGPGPIETPSYLFSYSGEQYRQFSQELRLESQGDGPLSYMVGGYYEYGKLVSDFLAGNFLAPFGARVPTVYNATTPIASRTIVQQRSDTWSGFGSATYELFTGLKITGSLRYTDVRKAADRSAVLGTGGAFPTPATFVPGPPQVQAILSAAVGQSILPFPIGKRNDDQFMPAANVRYQFTSDILGYLSYAHGFKAGGFSGSTIDIFAPETVNSYEAGIKAQWLNRQLTTNFALFRANYTNLQEAQNIVGASGAPTQVITNAAESRASGVEFGGSYRTGRFLTLRMDAAYLDSHYVKYPNAPCNPIEAAATPNCTRDRSGGRRAYAPEWSGSVGADVEVPVRSNLSARFGTTLAFTSSYYEQPAISYLVRQPGYAKLDLRAAVGPSQGRWEVAVIAKNVTNKITADYRNYAPAAVGSTYGIADRPRSIAVQVSTRW